MSILRSIKLPISVLLLALLPATQALACRCADQGLGEYYKLADSVLFVKVTGAKKTHYPRAGVAVTATQVGKSFKGSPERITTFFTGADSASCGIKPQSNTHWLFFVQHDPDHPGIGHVHSCNGTRAYDPRAKDGIRGFLDTPKEAVIPALNLLRNGKTPAKARGLILDKPVGGTPEQFSVIGLLEMPALLEPERFRESERAGFKPIPVYAAPLAGAAIIDELDDRNDLPTTEFSYERPGAVVHQTKPGWYRIAMRGDRSTHSGWIESSAANAYWPLEKLLPESLTYLTEYWDKLVWPHPGAGLPIRAATLKNTDDGKHDVKVIDKKYVADSLWWQVQIYDSSPCTSRTEPRIIYRGWVPAFDTQGRNTTWFWSRGC